MRNYLSFGGGVNSVALYLHLLDLGMEPGDPEKGFEAVFVDHGGDWPETYRYVEMFRARYPLTVLRPEYRGYNSIIEYFRDKKTIPTHVSRDCTHKFKSIPLDRYYQKPCFVMVGIDVGESHRAKIGSKGGIEYRWPLIEAEIDRRGCLALIARHGLPVPPKSGCFICPWQGDKGYLRLRREEPCLFALASELEQTATNERKTRGKGPLWIRSVPLVELAKEGQAFLSEEFEYPPCSCGL